MVMIIIDIVILISNKEIICNNTDSNIKSYQGMKLLTLLPFLPLLPDQ